MNIGEASGSPLKPIQIKRTKATEPFVIDDTIRIASQNLSIIYSQQNEEVEGKPQTPKPIDNVTPLLVVTETISNAVSQPLVDVQISSMATSDATSIQESTTYVPFNSPDTVIKNSSDVNSNELVFRVPLPKSKSPRNKKRKDIDSEEAVNLTL